MIFINIIAVISVLWGTTAEAGKSESMPAYARLAELRQEAHKKIMGAAVTGAIDALVNGRFEELDAQNGDARCHGRAAMVVWLYYKENFAEPDKRVVDLDPDDLGFIDRMLNWAGPLTAGCTQIPEDAKDVSFKFKATFVTLSHLLYLGTKLTTKENGLKVSVRDSDEMLRVLGFRLQPNNETSGQRESDDRPPELNTINGNGLKILLEGTRKVLAQMTSEFILFQARLLEIPTAGHGIDTDNPRKIPNLAFSLVSEVMLAICAEDGIPILERTRNADGTTTNHLWQPSGPREFISVKPETTAEFADVHLVVDAMSTTGECAPRKWNPEKSFLWNKFMQYSDAHKQLLGKPEQGKRAAEAVKAGVCIEDASVGCVVHVFVQRSTEEDMGHVQVMSDEDQMIERIHCVTPDTPATEIREIFSFLRPHETSPFSEEVALISDVLALRLFCRPKDWDDVIPSLPASLKYEVLARVVNFKRFGMVEGMKNLKKKNPPTLGEIYDDLHDRFTGISLMENDTNVSAASRAAFLDSAMACVHRLSTELDPEQFQELCTRTHPETHDTLLSLAIELKNLRLVEIFLDNGSDPNALYHPKRKGKSPLGHACLLAVPELVTLLLDRGAERDRIVFDGKTVVELTLGTACKHKRKGNYKSALRYLEIAKLVRRDKKDLEMLEAKAEKWRDPGPFRLDRQAFRQALTGGRVSLERFVFNALRQQVNCEAHRLCKHINNRRPDGVKFSAWCWTYGMWGRFELGRIDRDGLFNDFKDYYPKISTNLVTRPTMEARALDRQPMPGGG